MLHPYNLGLKSQLLRQLYILPLLFILFGLTIQQSVLAQPCPSPFLVTVNNVQGTTATVIWLPAGIAQGGYQVWVSEGAGPFELKETTQSIPYQLKGLKTNTNYRVKVKAVCGPNSISEFSTEAQFKTLGEDPTGCSPPEGLTLVGLQANEASLFWQFSPNATLYEIQISLDGQNWETVDESELTFYTIEGLEPNTTYFVRIRSICNDDEFSDFSDLIDFTTPEENTNASCQAPVGFQVFDLGGTSAALQILFNDPSNIPQNQGIVVRYYPANDPNNIDSVTVSPFEGAFITGLQPNTRYIVEIYGVCIGFAGVEFTERIDGDFTTLDVSELCEAPFFFDQVGQTANSATIAWEPQPGVIMYEVSWSEDGGDTWNTEQLTMDTPYTIEGLQSDTPYLVRIRSLCEDQKFSDYSEWGDVFTGSDNGCPSPSDVKVTNVSETTAKVSWSPVGNGDPNQVSGYMIVYTDGMEQFEVFSTNPNATLTDLMPGTFYTAAVYTVCIGPDGEEIFSPERRFDFKTEGDGPCLPVEFVDFDFVRTREAQIRWFAGQNAVSFVVVVRSRDGSFNKTYEVDEPFLNIPGLSPISIYDVTIQVICENGDSSSIEDTTTFETRGEIECPRLRGLVMFDIGMNEATATWTAPQGFTEFEVFLFDAQDNLVEQRRVPASPTTFTGLLSNRVYVVFVRGYCRNDRGQVGVSQALQRQFITLGDTTDGCEAPKNLKVSNVTPNSALVTWDAINNALVYEVEFSTDGGMSWQVAGQTAENRAPLNQLQPGMEFLIRITTLCLNQDRSEPSDSIFIKIPTGNNCPKPQNVKTSPLEDGRILLSWRRASTPSITHQVFWSTNCRDFELIHTTGSDTAYVFENLVPGRDYCAYVVAVCGNGNISSPSDTVRFGTTVPKCDTPKEVRSESIGQTVAIIRWNTVTGAIGYQVSYGLTSQNLKTVFAGANRMALDSLKPGTCYFYQVLAICEGGLSSAPSPPQQFCTEAAPTCPKPESVVATVLTAETAQVLWSPVPGARDYIVQISTNNQNFTPVATTQVSEFMLEDLQPNTRYYVRIIARCGEIGSSEPSQPAQFRTPAPCPAPSGLRLVEVRDLSATVTWNAVSGAQGYIVYVQFGPALPFEEMQFVNQPGYVIQDLSPGSAYRVYIKTVCQDQAQSKPSDTLVFQTTSPNCPKPVGVVVSNVQENSATVSWTTVAGAIGYRVLILNANRVEIDQMQVTTATANITNLEDGETYFVTVQTICSGELLSTPSDEVLIRTPKAFVCNAPATISVSQITPTTAFASWPRVTTAKSYRVSYSSSAGTVNLPPQTATSLFLNNLTPNTDYVITIQSVCGVDSLSDPSTPHEFETPALPPCPTPGGVVLGEVTAHATSVVWQAVTGVLSYQVILYDSSGSVIRQLTATGTSLDITNLQPGTKYSVAVRSICANQVTSDPSEKLPFVTPLPADCKRPEGVDVISRSSNSATLEWQAVPGAVAYEVSISKNGGVSFASTVTNNTTIVLTSIPQDSTWIVRVRTVCGGSRFSPYSPPIEVKPASPTDCPMPRSFVLDDITPTTVFVFWAPTPGVIGYEVSYLTSTGWVKLPITQRTNQLITGLMPKTTYSVGVRAVCANGTFSDYTVPVPFITPEIPGCQAPASISTTRLDPTVMGLKWPKVSGAVGYEVSYSADGGLTYTRRFTQDTTLLVSNLQAGVEYLIKIRTLCAGNIYSEPVLNSFRTPLPNECSAPQNLKMSSKSVDFMVFDWSPVTGAIRYQVEYRVAPSANFITLPPSTETEVEIQNLQPQDSVYVRVRTICSQSPFSASPYTDLVSGITDPLPLSCPNVTQMSFPDVRTTSAVASWNAPAGPPVPISYEVLFSRDGGQTFEAFFTTDLNMRFTQLIERTTYFVQIRSVCAGNVKSEPSGTFTFTTTGEDICPVPLPEITFVSDREAVVGWPAIFGSVVYEVSVSDSPNGPFTLHSYTQDSSVRFSNMMPNDTIYVRVRNVCSLSPSQFSNYSTTVSVITINDQRPCLPPTNLIATNITVDSAFVTWTSSASTTALEYMVLYSSDNGMTYDTVMTNSSSIFLRHLKPSTEYLVKVFTLCTENLKSDHVSVKFATPKPVGCTTPSNFMVSNVKERSAEVRWDVVTGAIGYQLSYKETNSNFYTLLTVSTNQYTIAGLTPSSKYIVQVRAICDTSSTPYTAWTQLEYFETKEQVLGCPAPTFLDITPGVNQATISWPAIPNATQYQVSYGENSSFTLLNRTVSTNQVVLSNLKANTRYKVRVRVICGVDLSPFTPTVQFTTLSPREEFTSSSSFSMELYPNPARGAVQLRFESNHSGMADIRLLDLTGKEVQAIQRNTEIGENNLSLPLDGLASGLYFVQIQLHGEVYRSKLWVQN